MTALEVLASRPCTQSFLNCTRKRVDNNLGRNAGSPFFLGTAVTTSRPLAQPQRHRAHCSKHGARLRVAAVSDHPLIELPYPHDSFEPVISRASVDFHWGAHHRSVLRRLNQQLREGGDDALLRLPLEELVKAAYNQGNPLPVFDAAAEAWNHNFFWGGLKPSEAPRAVREAQPSLPGQLQDLIARDFGTFDAFETQFRRAAASLVGSGYVWLSAKVETLVPAEWLDDLKVPNAYRLQIARLVVEKTCNAFNPLVFDRIHAYISDHGIDRDAYVQGFLEQLVSWDVVDARIQDAESIINFWEMPTPEDALVRPGEIAGRPFKWTN